jgi:RNA polymerase sigma-70 factor (ECF subfamily)
MDFSRGGAVGPRFVEAIPGEGGIEPVRPGTTGAEEARAMSEVVPFRDLMVRVRGGDNDAAAVIFRRFARRLIALASRQFVSSIRDRVDVEDLVQSVFTSLFARLQQGRFELADWEGLWGLLTRITVRKCHNRRRDLLARRRDIRREAGAPSEPDGRRDDAVFLDREPNPEEVAMLAELVDELLKVWEPPEREVVELILLEYSTSEIVACSGRSERTVRRLRKSLQQRLERMHRRGLDLEPPPAQ